MWRDLAYRPGRDGDSDGYTRRAARPSDGAGGRVRRRDGHTADLTAPHLCGQRHGDRVSFTFDSDHGSVGNAAAYLDILEQRHVRATFFLTGAFARDNPAVVQRIVADGDDVGNHTLDHPDLVAPPRTDGFVCDEFTQAERLISTAGGRLSAPIFPATLRRPQRPSAHPGGPTRAIARSSGALTRGIGTRRPRRKTSWTAC